MFYVYILECYDSKGKMTYYTGSTNNVERRLREHRSGRGARYTRMRKNDLTLVYLEQYETLKEARKREAEIKKMSHAEKDDLAYCFDIEKMTPDIINEFLR